MSQFFRSKMTEMLAAVLVFATPTMATTVALVCAMCGLPIGDHQTHAYNTSVLFMMAVPYGICAIGALVAYFAYRNANKRRLNEQIEDAGEPILDR